MTVDPIETTKITIMQDERPNRRAYIEGFEEPLHFGVHGGVKEFYGVEPEIEYPSTLDHIVSAAGGWLTGTLAGALEAREISTFPDKLKGHFEGIIEEEKGILKITRIRCHYELKIPIDKIKEAKRALDVFEQGCPVAQTLKGCIEFEHSWEIEKT